MKPPNVKPAAGAAGDETQLRYSTRSNLRLARKQGKAENARNELECLFAPSARQWAMTVTKATTRAVVVFSLHDSERGADSVVSRLRQFGLDASSSPTRPDVLAPGMTINANARR